MLCTIFFNFIFFGLFLLLMFIILTFQPLQVNNIFLTLWNFGRKDLINHRASSLMLLCFILWKSFVIGLNILKRVSKNKLTANIFPEQVRIIQECVFPADITVLQVSGVHLVITNQVISGEKQNLTKHVRNSRKQPTVFKTTIFFFFRESGMSR